MKQRLRVIFSGSVQGVGFRYTTERIARKFDVTGYVRNLTDGRVELVSEGDAAETDRFFAAVRESGLKAYIRDTETQRSAATGEFQGFEIAF